MIAKIIDGDLFLTDAKYIVHQCNCVTWRAAHLSAEVFKRYPYANIYAPRQPTDSEPAKQDEPGTIIVKGDGQDQRYVINLLGQFYPGRPRYSESAKDGFEARKRYFFEGLKKIAEIPDLKSIAFPWGIGCGAAGGDWNFYHKLINRFAKHVENKASVTIYKLQ